MLARSVSSSSAREERRTFTASRGSAEAIEQREQRGDQLGLGADARLAPDVHVPLEVLALAAAGRALVAPVLGDREPAQRQPQAPGARHHHARERGRHLGPQRVAALVQLEVVELLDDLLAGLAGEELLGLEHRGVHLLEGEGPGHGAEMLEEPVAAPQILGVEVARAAGGLQAGLAHAESITTSPWRLSGAARAATSPSRSGRRIHAAPAPDRRLSLCALALALVRLRQRRAGRSDRGSRAAPAARPPRRRPRRATADLAKGLVLALAQFVERDGKPVPGPARLEFLAYRDGKWQMSALEDPESNVFHKALAYAERRPGRAC